MSDTPQGAGWWVASDDKWYPPELHPDYTAPTPGETAAEHRAESIEPVTGFTEVTESVEPATGDFGTVGVDDRDTGRSRGWIGFAVAAVVVVGLGLLLFRACGGGGADTGAESPEAVVDGLIASVAAGDVVGFVELIDPAEVDSIGKLVDPLADAIDELADALRDELDELDEQQDLGSLDEVDVVREYVRENFDIEMTGVDTESPTYRVTSLGDDDRFAAVQLESVRLSFEVAEGLDEVLIGSVGDGLAVGIDLRPYDGSWLTLEDSGDGLSAEVFVPDLAEESGRADDAHLELVTIERDGRWYLSLGYTLAELGRGQAEALQLTDRPVAAPDFGRAMDLVESGAGGAGSPEDLVRDAFEAAFRLDYAAVIELVDPVGVGYLHDYQPLIDENADPDSLAGMAAEADLRMDRLDMHVETDDDQTIVVIDYVELSGAEGIRAEIDMSTWCFEVDAEGESESGCVEEMFEQEMAGSGSDAELADLIDAQMEMLENARGVAVVERNGRWYLDPVAQAARGLRNLVAVGTAMAGPMADQFDAMMADFDVNVGGAATAPVLGPVVEPGQAISVDAVEGLAAFAVAVGPGDGSAAVEVGVVKLTGSSSWELGGDSFDAGEPVWALAVPEPIAPPGLLPAMMVEVDGTVDVEVETTTAEWLADLPLDGSIGPDGAPVVFEYFGTDLEVDGPVELHYLARAPGVVALAGETTPVEWPDLVAITGAPGAAYTLSYSGFDYAEDESSSPYLGSGTEGDGVYERFGQFSEFVASGYGGEYFQTQTGSYMDGCGPDDPDVATDMYQLYSFDAGNTWMITVYPSPERAEAAFEAMIVGAPTCSYFDPEGLSIDSVAGSWLHIDFVEEVEMFERYELSGAVILTATGSRDGIETAIDAFDQFKSMYPPN